MIFQPPWPDLIRKRWSWRSLKLSKRSRFHHPKKVTSRIAMVLTFLLLQFEGSLFKSVVELKFNLDWLNTTNTRFEHFSGIFFFTSRIPRLHFLFSWRKLLQLSCFSLVFLFFYPPLVHIFQPNLPRVEWPAAIPPSRQLFPRLKGSVGKPRLPFSPKGAVAVPSDGSAARRLTAQWLEERWRIFGKKTVNATPWKVKQWVFFWTPKKWAENSKSLERESFFLIPCHFNFRA